MYAVTPVKTPVKPLKSRLGLKLAAIFAGAFLAAFIGLLFWDLLLMLGEKVLMEQALAEKPPVTVIDPKLESDLAKVLEATDVQNTADIKNPFRDASGISDKPNGTTAPSAAQTNAVAKAVNPAAEKIYPQKNQQNVAAKTALNVAAPIKPDPVTETRTRLQIREERIRLGEDGGPEAMAFAIDDLLPVGTVSGGDGKDEVMFYSTSACRVVSFPVGTQFYDGLFDSIRPEGVVFSFFDQNRTRSMRAWGRSVSTGCQSISITPQANQALTAEGGD